MKFEKFIGITFCSWSKQVKLQEMSHFCGGYCLSTLFRVCSMRASWKGTLMLWTTHKLVTVGEPLYMYYYMKSILKCQGTPTIFLSNHILKNLKKRWHNSPFWTSSENQIIIQAVSRHMDKFAVWKKKMGHFEWYYKITLFSENFRFWSDLKVIFLNLF